MGSRGSAAVPLRKILGKKLASPVDRGGFMRRGRWITPPSARFAGTLHESQARPMRRTRRRDDEAPETEETAARGGGRVPATRMTERKLRKGRTFVANSQRREQKARAVALYKKVTARRQGTNPPTRRRSSRVGQVGIADNNVIAAFLTLTSSRSRPSRDESPRPNLGAIILSGVPSLSPGGWPAPEPSPARAWCLSIRAPDLAGRMPNTANTPGCSKSKGKSRQARPEARDR